jgi:thioredoxin reductase
MNDSNPKYDCIIVGGSAAGLSAALALGRARRRVLVIDAGQPRNAPAHESHTFFTRDGISPAELLQIGRDQLLTYPNVSLRMDRVQQIQPLQESRASGFAVTVQDNVTPLNARKIILATGVVDELPSIEGFREFWGGSIFHCPFCHGWEVQDQPTAVLGNGDIGIQMVTLFRGWSHDIVLCTNGPATFTTEQRDLLAKYHIPIREEHITRVTGIDGQLGHIVFESGETLARSAIFCRPGQHLATPFATDLGCELAETGLIQIDTVGQTSVPGVYAAGDLTHPMQQGIAMAVSRGALAGFGVTHALLHEEFI